MAFEHWNGKTANWEKAEYFYKQNDRGCWASRKIGDHLQMRNPVMCGLQIRSDMKLSCSLAFIILLANVAHAQARKGSIGIIYHSENKIVIAADSQGNIVGAPPVYDECKVSALGKHMVVLNLNLTGWAGGRLIPLAQQAIAIARARGV
jgi:hypothetical protein